MAQRTNLLSLTAEDLRVRLDAFFGERGQPSYRTAQVSEWIFERDALSFDEMTSLPVAERIALADHFDLEEPALAEVAESRDGTAKHLWRLRDGELVESVLIPAPDRLTLCLSSQAGCALACTFCATGWAGFRRHLDAGEIVSQYRLSRRWAEDRGYGRITNVVYMGMGEPLANRATVLTSLEILNRGYGLGARRITVSTVGVVPGILALAKRPEQFRLAISLHSPVSQLRRELIPLEKRWPLPTLVEALHRFNEAGGRRITFEYVMIRDVNDAPDLAEPLADLAAELRAFVNLIPFNPIPYRDWQASTAERVEWFRRALDERGIAVAVREPRGRDIDAACGQLRANALVELKASGPR